MRRVVVTGMGIVSSIGNNSQEVLASLREAKSGIVRAEKYAELGFRCQVHGEPQHGLGERWSRARRAASWRPASAGTTSPWTRPSATPGSSQATSSTSAPASSWARAAPPRAPSCAAPTPPARRTRSKIGPFEVPKGMCSGPLRQRSPPPPDQGRQLFDLVGLLDLGPLHRQCRRAHRMGQAGRDVRRRLRGARLDAFGAVRRHGRHVDQVQRHAREGKPRLRQGPRRASSSPAGPASSCWRSWSTPRPAAPGSTASWPATAPPPTASTWWRLPARALSDACAWRSQGTRRQGRRSTRSTTSIRTAPARPSATCGRSRRSAPVFGERHAAHLLDQVAHRPFAGRDRRAGGDLSRCS